MDREHEERLYRTGHVIGGRNSSGHGHWRNTVHNMCCCHASTTSPRHWEVINLSKSCQIIYVHFDRLIVFRFPDKFVSFLWCRLQLWGKREQLHSEPVRPRGMHWWGWWIPLCVLSVIHRTRLFHTADSVLSEPVSQWSRLYSRHHLQHVLLPVSERIHR